jgi:single stranded DNA-binding protein
MLNTVAVVGVLARDPHMRLEDNGTQVTSFTLKIEEPGKDGQTFSLFVNVECYGRKSEQAAFLGAGDLVSVTGKLKFRSHVDSEGKKRGTLAVLAREVSVLVSAVLNAPQQVGVAP